MLPCPYCRSAQADGSCIRCGRPLRPPAPPQPDAPAPPGSDAPKAVLPPVPAFALRPVWKALLPGLALFVAAFAMIASVIAPARRSAARRPVAASTPPPRSAPSSAHALSPRPARLTADLFCARRSQPPLVGSRLLLTALADSAPGRAVSLTLSCRKDRGPASFVSMTEGRLCSVAWTPSAPGLYQFIATASDDHAESAVSPSLRITVAGLPAVTGPPALAALPPKPAPLGVRPLPPLPVGLGPLPALPVAAPPATFALPPPRARWRLARLPAASDRLPVLPPLSPVSAPPEPAPPAAAPGRLALGRTAPAPVAPEAAPPVLYHVVVASFPAARNAVVLAKSFWGRGVKVAVRHRPDSRGRTAYVVEAAASHNPATARQSALALQQSGYPAYYFNGE